ncbi:GLUG motif-containing protein [Anaerobaca lacustris]|uniref:GLUG motif-containing protein n=1 Tax=Anaerobaca lacustris TaxID=3044600 RepID=A0AAW6TXA0_9BACT|nr:GLUG motif-containing protein [Sedimentisphaerales bacterium M17dextr]
MATPSTFRACVAIPLFLALVCPATAAEQIDQSNLPEWGGGWTHVNPTADGQAVMWQTFTPACTSLTAVEIDILTVNPGRGDDVLIVEIARDGVVLASAERSVEDGFDDLLRVEFPEVMPLVPEQVYDLRVRDTGKGQFGWKYGSNTYERGGRFVFAQERPGTDWFFRTYTTAEPAATKYSGGTGEPNDPYQIATAADLIALGETPEDYDKHFILTADIDLDPNLPGRKVFDRAVIAPDTDPNTEWDFDGTAFSGVLDGNGHTISHLTIVGRSYLGLFGHLGYGAEVGNLGVIDVRITGLGYCIGGLAGGNGRGNVTASYSTGIVSGSAEVGGLVGANHVRSGITSSHSACAVTGDNYVGGLVGDNAGGSGHWGHIGNSYSTGTVTGMGECVGGLVGVNWGHVTQCYSTGAIVGGTNVGGLIGSSGSVQEGWGIVTNCLWDIETSGQTASYGGTGKTTAEMQTARTFLDAGWDFVGETANGGEDIWKIAEGLGYPRLAWEKYSGGTGEPNDPYEIATAADLIALGETPDDYDKHFILIADIDLDPNLPGRKVFDRAVIAPDTSDTGNWFDGPPFTGVFDGNAHTISRLTISGGSRLGLFGSLAAASVSNVGLVAADIKGTGDWIGGLVGTYGGFLVLGGEVTNCYSTGTVKGNNHVGGLVGQSWGGRMSQCNSTCAVHGSYSVGGLVGLHFAHTTTYCFSTGTVRGGSFVGGLMGINGGEVADCYSMSTVSGDSSVGGLVGGNYEYFLGHGRPGIITRCYSTGSVSGSMDVGGLVGENTYFEDMWFEREGVVNGSFWDSETSGRATSAGGTGLTTAEMQMSQTFLDAGWDFVGETANGTEDIWWMDEGKDYPRLWWELQIDE